jgi:hypothetical protein
MLHALTAVAGVLILLGVWLAVQRLADQISAERCATLPESRRHPLPDACIVCGGTCRARIHTPPRAEVQPTPTLPPPQPAEPTRSHL